jgi:hypothetical protein
MRNLQVCTTDRRGDQIHVTQRLAFKPWVNISSVAMCYTYLFRAAIMELHEVENISDT